MKLTEEDIEDFSELDWSASEWIVNEQNQTYYILIEAGNTSNDKRQELRKQILKNQEIVDRLREIDIEYIINLISKQGIVQGDRQSKIFKLIKIQSILGDKG